MKKMNHRIPSARRAAAAAFLLLASGGFASAANLMLDFGAATASGEYLTLSPGHAAGTVALAETTWNTISSSAANNALSWSDGNFAGGVTLTMGQESSAGSGSVSFSTAVSNLALAGTGGSASEPAPLGAMANLVHNGTPESSFTGSIYGTGNVAGNTAVGRDGFFGGGSASAGAAIGLRLEGLAAGDYLVYVMARNTNTNALSVPMAVYAAAGAAGSPGFNFSSLSSLVQSNPGYSRATYAGEYTSFVDGENYVATTVTIADGEALFLAVDGTGVETRGFLNAVQVVLIPEPSVSLLAAAGAFAWLRRRRR